MFCRRKHLFLVFDVFLGVDRKSPRCWVPCIHVILINFVFLCVFCFSGRRVIIGREREGVNKNYQNGMTFFWRAFRFNSIRFFLSLL